MARPKRTDPRLWDRVKREIARSDRGGRPGQWSARKAQLAVQAYKRRGGGYEGEKPDTHLDEWTREDWGTASGRRSRDTGERCLPKKAREALSDEEYRRTSRKKVSDVPVTRRCAEGSRAGGRRCGAGGGRRRSARGAL